ncbi:MAG: DUF2238 domain-containing protein [Nanoarchaeota archaeon]|nr:DUF2238 domain-containing protein [Nanoarchaeota archaeon]
MRKKDRVPVILIIIFAIFWLVVAINPYDRWVWLAENVLTVLLIGFLILTYKKFRFSNTSYVLLFSYLVFHTLGSYYTYTNMPLFNWLKDIFDLSRNHYDRLVHFFFGLAFYFPVYEFATQKLKLKGWERYLLPFLVIISFKAIYEIIEYLAVMVTHSSILGTSFLGMQGDQWDAQKDIMFGITGAAISMVVCRLRRK